jgi:hypothetical protein
MRVYFQSAEKTYASRQSGLKTQSSILGSLLRMQILDSPATTAPVLGRI